MARITQKSLDRLSAKLEKKKLSIEIQELQGKLLQTSDPVKRLELTLKVKQKKFQRQNYGKGT